MNQLRRLGRHAPIPVFILHQNIVLHFGLRHVVYPALHGRIALFDGAIIAKLAVKHVGYVKIGSRPSHVIMEDGPVTGRYHRDTSIFIHGLFYIHQPLLIHQGIAENETFTIGTGSAVAQPSKTFITLGAVGRHTAIVSTDSPIGILVKSVNQLLGSLERTVRCHFIIHHLTGEIIRCRFIVQTGYFHKTETMVNKQRFPNKLTVSGRSINIRDKGTAQVVKIQFRTIVLQHFGKTHGNGLVLLATQFHLLYSYHILPHIHDISSITYRFNGYWLYFLHHLQTRRELCHKFSFGSLHPFGQLPSGIIIAAFRPFTQFQAGIVMFTVKFVVRSYRTVVRRFPGIIADYRHRLTIVVLYIQLRHETGQTKTYHPIGAHGKIAAVAQSHAYRIGTGLQQGGDIIGQIRYRSIVPGRQRTEYIVSNPLAIHIAYGRAYSRNIKDCTLRL